MEREIVDIRPTRAIVDLGAIAFNVKSLKRHVGAGTLFMAVVKADGYGHGIVPVARTAVESGADWLGVALLEEGITLREAGIKVPILVLGEALIEGADLFVRYNITATVCSPGCLLALDQAADMNNQKASVHIKIDTGMGRIGLAPDEVFSFIKRAMSMKNIRVEGLFSHFSSVDEKDKGFSYKQLDQFNQVIRALETHGIQIPMKHFAGSAAVIDFPESYFDMVRPGISLYGVYPSPEVDHSVPLKPAMTLKTAIAFIKYVPAGTFVSYGRTFETRRKSRIATLPVGYADGYPRLLSNQGEVLVSGLRAPVVGRVCMDMTLIDVTDIPEATVGSGVVLFGKQNNGEILVDEIAEKAGTISHEILCGITKRVPKEYLNTPW